MSEQITIKIWTGYTAFADADNPGSEVSSILRHIASKFERADYPFGVSGPLRDSDDNTFGLVVIVHDAAGEL